MHPISLQATTPILELRGASSASLNALHPPPSANPTQRAICCRIFTPAALPEYPAASVTDYCSGAYTAMLDARMSYWDGHNRVYVTRAPKTSDVSCSRKTCAQSCTATVAGWGTTKNRPRIHIALLMPQGLGRRCKLSRRCTVSIISPVKPKIGKLRWRGGFARRFFRALRRDCPAMRPRPGRSWIDDRQIFSV